MTDNVGYTPGSGAIVAADEVNGALHQRVKPVIGEDGVAVDVSSSNPMPVQEVGGAVSILSRILQMLMSPMGFDRSISRQRVTAQIESGTVTTVTTVTGLSNIDGRPGAMLINQTNYSAWASVHRACIT